MSRRRGNHDSLGVSWWSDNCAALTTPRTIKSSLVKPALGTSWRWRCAADADADGEWGRGEEKFAVGDRGGEVRLLVLSAGI